MFEQKFVTLGMESMAFLNYQSVKAGAEYEVFGNLKIHQKQTVANSGVDIRYNVSLCHLNVIHNLFIVLCVGLISTDQRTADQLLSLTLCISGNSLYTAVCIYGVDFKLI